MSTGIGMGLAIPHAKIPSVTDFVMAVGRSLEGIEFDSLDDLPVNIVILIGSSDTQGPISSGSIAKIGGLFNRPASGSGSSQLIPPPRFTTSSPKRTENAITAVPRPSPR